jgi:hypothetical protein
VTSARLVFNHDQCWVSLNPNYSIFTPPLAWNGMLLWSPTHESQPVLQESVFVDRFSKDVSRLF